MDNKNILISGAGIAGVTLAFWLKKFGFQPTIIEVSPQLREGGYAIDFMGAGYDVAEKMGIIPELKKADINISKLVFVDKDNKEIGHMNYQAVSESMNNRAITILRSDLARIISHKLDPDIEIILGDSISKIEQRDEKVMVTLKSGLNHSFDLLIGADGLHSNVRKLVFGNETHFEKYFGYYTSSYTIDHFSHEGKMFSMYNIPDKQVAVYSHSEGKTGAFFIFASPEKIMYDHHNTEEQKRILRNQFQHAGWKCLDLLSKMDAAPDFYFDSVSQIEIENWTKNRVTLVGDACYCPSLLSGKGSTLAMAGAYVLAGELKSAKGNYQIAFSHYEKIFKPFINKKQKSARTFAKSFVPKSSFGIWLRNLAFKLMSWPFFSKLFLNQFQDKELILKDY